MYQNIVKGALSKTWLLI